MLSRYTIYRRRPSNVEPLPDGIRQDARYRTKHILRPTPEMVEQYLADPTEAAWHIFKEEYKALLKDRYQEDRTPFDQLAELAANEDVFLGCSCPTKRNPVVGHCHTYLALVFMREKYPALDVVIPKHKG